MRILIVGAVAAGASAATRMRRLNENAEIIMYDKGDYASFSNCSLPYYVGGVIKNEESLVLMTPEKFSTNYNIQVKLKNEVKNVDPNNKSIVVKDLQTGIENEEKYDKLILAPGARAIVPSFEGLDKIKHFTVKTVNDVSQMKQYINENTPENVTVIGGGFIGVEMVENLRKLNLDVTLVEGSDQVIAPLDKEMAHIIHEELLENNINLIFGDLVEKFDTNKVILKSNKEIESDFVVLAIGVRPETEFINDVIDIDRGYIKVNDNYQTSDPDIYAAGDAILINDAITNEEHPLALAGPANKQGRLIADHINGREIINNGYIGSSVISIFNYIAASTGLNEKKAKELNLDYSVAYAAPTDKVSIIPSSDKMPIKIIFENNSGKLLGGQVVATGNSDKRVDVLATALKAGMTVYDLQDLELTYAPTVGTGKDVVNKIGYVGANLNDKLYKQITFLEVDEKIKAGEQVIDVRETFEYEKAHVNGTINIPMSTIRNNLDKIDKSKKVYVHCQSGQRSYNVTMMLTNLGYDVYNVAGGFYFYNLNKNMEDKLY